MEDRGSWTDFGQMDISTCDPEITTNVSSEVEKVMNEEWSRIAGENSNLPSWKPTKESCQPFPGVSLLKTGYAVKQTDMSVYFYI